MAHWAEAITTYEAPTDDAAFERLRQFFSDDEIMELTWVSALFNMVNRVHDALKLDVEQQGEVDKIRRSRVLNEAQVLKYVRRALEAAEQELEERAQAAAPGHILT